MSNSDLFFIDTDGELRMFLPWVWILDNSWMWTEYSDTFTLLFNQTLKLPQENRRLVESHCLTQGAQLGAVRGPRGVGRRLKRAWMYVYL